MRSLRFNDRVSPAWSAMRSHRYSSACPVRPICMLAPDEASSLPLEARLAQHVSEGGADEGIAREAEGLVDVAEPSPAEVALHNLTHLPYKRWCRWCVAARRANAPHTRLPPFSRTIQLCVLDYCVIKHHGDKKWLTVLVGRLYPSRALFAAPCTTKGPDSHCTARLASFFRACGVQQLTYMCDQAGWCAQ